MAITKKKILPGALVMVSFPIEKEQTKNPARQFEGLEFTVKTKHIANGPMAKPQYTLYGCEGPNHKPYWFLEDELVVLSEVSEMNRYIDAEALKEKYTDVWSADERSRR